MSKHLRLSTYEKPGSNPKLVTSCVVTISNYCWFEKIKDKAPKHVKCEDKDFDISFKLSSTAFATPGKVSNEYHFDRNGVKLTYNQAYLLFRSERFTTDYLGKVKKYFDRDQDIQTGNEVYENGLTDYESENEIEVDNDVYEAASSQPPPPTPTIKNSVIKRLRKL